MNTAVTITAIICTALIFFATLMFLSGREEREFRKNELIIKSKELDIKNIEIMKDMPTDLVKLVIAAGGKNNEQSENNKH